MATNGPSQSREPGTYGHLLEKAHEKGLESVSCEVLAFPGDFNDHRAVVRVSTVFPGGRFSALGEASLNGNESPGELLELAEQRAKVRAFSDALNGSGSREMASRVSRPSTTKESSAPPTRSSSTGNGRDAPKEEASTRVNSDDMTSAQRRFLFRLVCEQGVDPKQANDTICGLAGVKYLKEIGKKQASELIDDLQHGEIRVGGRKKGGEGNEDIPF